MHTDTVKGLRLSCIVIFPCTSLQNKKKKRLQLRVPFWILEVLYHCPGFWIPAIPAGWVYASRLPAGTMDLLSLLPTHTVLYGHTHFVQTHCENLSHR